MARFTAQGLNYPDACQLINTLRLAGIEANITAGGVAVCPEPQQATQAQQICKDSGASFNAGYSAHQEDVMLRSPDGWNVAERVTNDARSVLKEWRE